MAKILRQKTLLLVCGLFVFVCFSCGYPCIAFGSMIVCVCVFLKGARSVWCESLRLVSSLMGFHGIDPFLQKSLLMTWLHNIYE